MSTSTESPTAQKAYDTWHSAREVDTEADAPWHRLVRDALRPSDLDGRDVLEIGCGRGGFSCFVAGMGKLKSQLAVDYSDAAVAKGREHAEAAGLKSITWEQGDIQNIARPTASFDTVISCETVEHVPEPKRAIAELARVLRPGGRLFLTTPNYFGTLGLYRGYLRLRGRVFQEVGQPINQFTMLPLTAAWVRREGLTVEHTDAVGHFIPFPGRPPFKVDLLDRGNRMLTKWVAHHSLIVARKS